MHVALCQKPWYECNQRVKPGGQEIDGYQVDGLEEEAWQNKSCSCRLQTLGASTESVGNHDFYRPVEGGHIHEDLGIDPSVKLPRALPVSLVNSIKPTHDGPEGADSDRA